MNTLNDYTQEKQTKLFNDTGAFFAFSSEQFNEKQKKGVKYVAMASGLMVPKENFKKLFNGLKSINDDGVKQDISDNGITAIIHRELANYEAQITGDISNTVEALEDYGITRSQVSKEYKAYYQHCINNDYF